MTTTLGAITPGDWERATYGPNGCPIIGNRLSMVAMLAHSIHHDDQRDEAEANATLIADAGTTANKCGKLPSQLLQERDELVGAVGGIRSSWAGYHLSGDYEQNRKMVAEMWKELKRMDNAARALLSKHLKP